MDFVGYVEEIFEEFKEFHKCSENMALFGEQVELNDLKRAAGHANGSQVSGATHRMPFVIVPVTR